MLIGIFLFLPPNKAKAADLFVTLEIFQDYPNYPFCTKMITIATVTNTTGSIISGVQMEHEAYSDLRYLYLDRTDYPYINSTGTQLYTEFFSIQPYETITFYLEVISIIGDYGPSSKSFNVSPNSTSNSNEATVVVNSLNKTIGSLAEPANENSHLISDYFDALPYVGAVVIKSPETHWICSTKSTFFNSW